MNLKYKNQNYKRIVHSNLGNGVEVITWWLMEISGYAAYDIPLYDYKEVFNNDFANELEIYYESIIVDSLTPQITII